MKKIALSLAVVATLAMVSCGNKAENTDSDTTTVDTTMTMTEEVVAVDSDSNKADAAKVEETVAPANDSNKAAAPADTKEEPKADKK